MYFNFVLFMKGTIVILPEVQLPSILSSYRDVIIGSLALLESTLKIFFAIVDT